MIGTITEGLIFALMVLGVYITYKILDFPDLTADSSFVLGAAVLTRCLSQGLSLPLSMVFAGLAGGLAGYATGYIHTKFGITNLLSGILVMIGLYSINLRILGRANVNLFTVDHLFSTGNSLIKVGVIILVVKLMLDMFFKTHYGYLIRLVGDNPNLIESFGLDPQAYKRAGIVLANGLVALSGALLAQYQGYADINMGTGMLVMGLASIILGEAICTRAFPIMLSTAAIIGSIIYRYALAMTLKIGFAPSDLKIITALILLGILIVNNKGVKAIAKV
jgi:putative ABC transport system permease protein